MIGRTVAAAASDLSGVPPEFIKRHGVAAAATGEDYGTPDAEALIPPADITPEADADLGGES